MDRFVELSPVHKLLIAAVEDKPVEPECFGQADVPYFLHEQAQWLWDSKSPLKGQLEFDKAYREGRGPLKQLFETLHKNNGCVIGTTYENKDTKRRLEALLAVGPQFVDTKGKFWRIGVKRVSDTVRMEDGKSVCDYRLVWLPKSESQRPFPVVSGPAGRAASPAGAQPTHVPRVSGSALSLIDARQQIWENCHFVGQPGEDDFAALDAAVRARLLAFDNRHSGFKGGDPAPSRFKSDLHQDRAIFALTKRLLKWPYCLRILVDEGGDTLGYVSAGPMRFSDDGRRPSLGNFADHADNFEHQDLLWGAPTEIGPVALCFSGFRLHPQLRDEPRAWFTLIDAANQVLSGFHTGGYDIRQVILSLIQPTGRYVLRSLNALGASDAGAFLRVAPLELERVRRVALDRLETV